MSAFILNDEGYQQLATEIFNRIAYNSQYPNFCHQLEGFTTAKHSFSDEKNFEKIVAKVEEIRKANYQAVNERYSDSEDLPEYIEYRNGYMKKWNDVQFVKNLQCVLYQMSEGSVYESDIYKQLKQLIQELCEALFTRSTEYKEASWGW